jgi:hypothetical protein
LRFGYSPSQKDPFSLKEDMKYGAKAPINCINVLIQEDPQVLLQPLSAAFYTAVSVFQHIFSRLNIIVLWTHSVHLSVHLNAHCVNIIHFISASLARAAQNQSFRPKRKSPGLFFELTVRARVRDYMYKGISKTSVFLGNPGEMPPGVGEFRFAFKESFLLFFPALTGIVSHI